jgi:hypothetical protein
MVTLLARLEGAARRAALGGVAAGLAVGLAACGSAVAGAGSPAKAHDTPAPTATGINPGGPMVPASMSKPVALCGEIPHLTLVTIGRSSPLPSEHVREVIPNGYTVRDAATVRQLATLLCALPRMPAGGMSCPDLVGGTYRMSFAAARRSFTPVVVQLSGCRVVTGLGPVRSWARSAQIEEVLSQGFKDHLMLILPPS